MGYCWFCLGESDPMTGSKPLWVCHSSQIGELCVKLISFQTSLIALLILWYGGNTLFTLFFSCVYGALVLALTQPGLVPDEVLWYGQAGLGSPHSNLLLWLLFLLQDFVDLPGGQSYLLSLLYKGKEIPQTIWPFFQPSFDYSVPEHVLGPFERVRYPSITI